jgi:hypothetical protein
LYFKLDFISIFPFFITDFINLGLLPPPFCHVGCGFANLFKESTFCFIDYVYTSVLISLILTLVVISLSASFGFVLFLFF